MQQRSAPDGSRLSYARGNVDGTGWFTIISAKIDGSGERTVARKVAWRGEHRWSPESREIAYVGGVLRDSQAAIFVADANGRNRRQLTHDGEYKTVPEWSPDGQWLAFTKWSDDDYRIYLIAGDGRQQRRLPANGESPVWRPPRG